MLIDIIVILTIVAAVFHAIADLVRGNTDD